MIRAFVSDFSKVLLSAKDQTYTGGLNALHKKLSADGNYDFWSHFQLNRSLLDFYKTIGKKTKVYLFTSEYIQEHPALQSEIEGIFEMIFSGIRLGLRKRDVAAYKKIAEMIGVSPAEILYMDDKQVNCDAAQAAGMVVIRYESNDQVVRDINSVLD